MHLKELSAKEQERVLAALNECYRRLKKAQLQAADLSTEGFKLLFQSAYQDVLKYQK